MPNPARAFPGAEGYGALAMTTCDRSNVQVLQVTRLADDTSSGSLRWAVGQIDSSRLTVIIFRVAGYITLGSDLVINRACVYFAGQTAPGGGITVRRSGSGRIWINSGASDVVVRYLRFASMSNSFIVRAGPRIFIDHISSRWMTNTALTVTKSLTHGSTYQDVTLSHNIFSEGVLNPTSLGNIISQDPRWGDPVLTRVDIHNNLYAHNSHRQPLIGIREAKIVNNVMYNWNQSAVQSGDALSKFDVINNFFKLGPTQSTHTRGISPRCNSDPPGGTDTSTTDGANSSIYAVGNVGVHSTTDGADNWTGSTREVGCYYKSGPGGSSGVDPVGLVNPGGMTVVFKRSSPLSSPTFPITARTATAAFTHVVTGRNAGANARIACNGDPVTAIDSVDARIYTETINRTRSFSGGAPSAPVGGHPTIASGTPCTYSSTDGIPDAYKVRYGLNTFTNYASVDLRGDGYTVLERYLAGLSPLPGGEDDPPPPVEPSKILNVSPASLSFDVVAGGSSVTKTVAISNIGSSEAMPWSATKNQAWISLSPTSSSNAGTLTVTINPSSLSVGQHVGIVTVTAVDAVGSPIEITVTVNALDLFTVSATTLDFTIYQNSEHQSLQVFVASTEIWTVRKSASLSMVTLSPTGRTGSGYFTASASPLSVDVGEYTGTLTVEFETEPFIVIDVTVTVLPFAEIPPPPPPSTSFPDPAPPVLQFPTPSPSPKFRDASGGYLQKTTEYTTSPRYFLRLFEVDRIVTQFGHVEFTETPFASDFSSGVILEETKPKIQCISDVIPGEVYVTPEMSVGGRSEYTIVLSDLEGQITGFLANASTQLRPGQRVQLFAGYEDLPESEYISLVKMEIRSVNVSQDLATITLRVEDLQRALLGHVFRLATSSNPVVLEGHPLVLALQVMLSTGAGINGMYDVLGHENGLGMSELDIDIEAFETLVIQTTVELAIILFEKALAEAAESGGGIIEP